MTIISIDPGSESSAFVLLEDRRVVSNGELHNEEMRRFLIGSTVEDIVCEMVACYGMAVGAEVFETVRWIGRFEELSLDRNKRFHPIFRRDIKLHLCGSMRAKDPNIRRALIDKLGPQGKKKSPGPTFGIFGHCWSALAVGITFLETRVPTFSNEKIPDKTSTHDGTIPNRTPDHVVERPEVLPENNAQHSNQALSSQTST